MLFKAGCYGHDVRFEEVACVVCASIPVEDWEVIGTDPGKVGMHCDTHKAVFHSVCEATYNCCEPYDPDRDYEWRPLE